jgi:hypothetical protein
VWQPRHGFRTPPIGWYRLQGLELLSTKSLMSFSHKALSLNFGEVCKATPSSLTSDRAVRCAARLVIILIDKILSTIESNC